MFESPLLAVVARDTWQSENAGMAVFVQDARIMRMCNFAAMTWVIYDWVFTLEDEVKYIWGSANTPPKILYLVSRYLGLLTVIPPATTVLPFYCYSRLTFTSVTYHVLFYCSEISLIIRVYALCGQEKRVALALIISFILLEASNLSLLIQGMLVFKAKTISVPSSWSHDGCVTLEFPTILRYSWVPDLVFNTIIFVLSCVRCMPYRSLPDAPLVTRVFRDGAIYYVCLLLFLLLFTIGLLAGDVIPYLDAFVTAVVSVASSHLLLSIRAYVHAVEQTSTVTAVSSCLLDFDMQDSTAATSYELAARTARTGRSTTTDMGQTITLRTVATEVLRDNADADNGYGGPTLSFTGDIERADPVSAVDDDAEVGHPLRSRRFNGFSDWIVAE